MPGGKLDFTPEETEAVLAQTHSPDYNLQGLPPPLRNETLDVLRPFALSMQQNACEAVHRFPSPLWAPGSYHPFENYEL